MKLVHKDSGKPVEIGEEVTDFRGEKAMVNGMEEPQHSGSTGRVYVKTEAGYTQGYYPSVFNLRWEPSNVEG